MSSLLFGFKLLGVPNSEEVDVPASTVNEARCSILITQRAANSPDKICLGSEDESLTFFDFNQIVNSLAQKLSEIPKSPTFLPMLLGPNVNSVIAYYAAIRSHTPFALIDSNTNPEYLKPILERLKNPKFIVNTNSEKMEVPDVEQIFVGREICFYYCQRSLIGRK